MFHEERGSDGRVLELQRRPGQADKEFCMLFRRHRAHRLAPRSPSSLRRCDFDSHRRSRSAVARAGQDGPVGRGMAGPGGRLDWAPTRRAWKPPQKIYLTQKPKGPQNP